MPKLAGKYETPEELERAYLEAQATLGKHGSELGTLRQQHEALAEERRALMEYAQSLAPMAAWYRSNLPALQQWWQTRQQAAQQPRQAQVPQAGVPQGWEQLNPGQQYQLMVQSAGQMAQQMTMNALRQYGPQYAKQVQSEIEGRVKNGMDVFHRYLEMIVPDDKRDRLKLFTEESLGFADPSKLNPMDLAHQKLALMDERDRATKERDELKQWREEREKAEVPSLGAGASTRAFDLKPSGDRLSREDRFKAAVDAVQTDHGREGVATLFGDRAA